MKKWQFWAVLLAMLLVSACNIIYLAMPDDSHKAKLRKELEDSGVYTKLDRSTDLKGPDQNLNGVRDDVEAWINAQAITDVQKKAIMQYAVAFQKTLFVDLTDKTAVIALDNEKMAGTSCVGDMFAPNRRDGYNLIKKIESITFNTKERTMRYIQYNQTPGAASTRWPEGNTCK